MSLLYLRRGSYSITYVIIVYFVYLDKGFFVADYKLRAYIMNFQNGRKCVNFHQCTQQSTVLTLLSTVTS